MRIVFQINGRTFIDLDSRLALAMIDCAFGQPVVNDYEVAPAVPGSQPTRLKLTLMEGGPPEVYPE